MTPAEFTRLALSLPGAEKGSHMGAVDFRVGGRIFATLASVAKGYGNLMLSPEQQRDFIAERPDIFVPVAGAWGEGGATHVRLALADEDLVRGALEVAWKRRVAANQKATRKTNRSRKAR